MVLLGVGDVVWVWGGARCGLYRGSAMGGGYGGVMGLMRGVIGAYGGLDRGIWWDEVVMARWGYIGDMVGTIRGEVRSSMEVRYRVMVGTIRGRGWVGNGVRYGARRGQ